jgi:hypothetical protein
MQLAIPHNGWDNEHLATFLLSRIAFVATPVKVGDDIGIDVFCTVFEVAKGKRTVLQRETKKPQRGEAWRLIAKCFCLEIVDYLEYRFARFKLCADFL